MKPDIKSIRKEIKKNHEKPDNSAKIVSIISVLVILIFLGVIYGKKSFVWFVASLPIEQTPVVRIEPLQVAINNVNFKYSWEKLIFSPKSNLSVTLNLNNNNDKTINNLEVICIPNSGVATLDSHKVTIFETIPSHSTKTISNYDFGALSNVDTIKDVACSITDISFN